MLRQLKKRRRIYYKPDNFISISGLMYRMKQNAVGLASICILCTMVIITLSTTFCLWFRHRGFTEKDIFRRCGSFNDAEGI